jgi:hypothetical protein
LKRWESRRTISRHKNKHAGNVDLPADVSWERRFAMCFEFEALYWARVAEEEMKRKEKEEKQTLQDRPATEQRKPQPSDEEPVPV